MAEAMGGYIRGVFIDSLLVGIITYIGLLIIGLDYPLVLAVLSGVLEIIPVIGPLLAGAAMVLVAILQAPDLVLIVLIFAVVLQQVESNIIVPNIMRGQAEVSPVLTILAIIAGERIGGVIGALIAIPLAAALRVFVVEVVAPIIRRRTGAWRSSGAEEEDREGGEET
jgi:predicted PurR-regulated permease PerM